MGNKKELIKGILAGKVSSEALSPPKFRMELLDSGELQCTIDGKVVSHDFYRAEQDRLGVSLLDDCVELIIHHRPESAE